MNNNYNPYYQNHFPNQNKQDERFIFPFLLGGVTGAAVAPAFWKPSPYGNNNYYQPMPYPPPYYGPYYR